MNEKLLLIKSFLIGGAALLATSCTNEEIIGGNPDSESGNPGLTISIKTPAADGVVFTKAATETTTEDEAAEWAVKTLNVYLFEKSGSQGGDTDYKLFKQTNLDLSSSEDVTDNSNGTYSYNEPITADMIGKTMKVVLVANDAPELESGKEADGYSGISLQNFKLKLAKKATVIEGSSADVLVGGTGDVATGFPMSYIAEEDITMTPMGESVSATLTRTVARLDIFNYTPNLTVTGVSLVKAVNKSYLLPQAVFADPADASYVTINATEEWQGKFGSGVGFVEPDKPEEQEEPWTPTETDYKNVNTLKHVLYMYEQANADGDDSKVATVKIEYTLKMGDGSTPKGTLEVKLSGISGNKINRNTLYTIKLGNGKEVKDEIKASVVVEDWVTEGNDVDVPVNPSEDDKVEP